MKPEPDIDADGVGWCDEECSSAHRSACLPDCVHCDVINSDPEHEPEHTAFVPDGSICLPYARQQAAKIKELEARANLHDGMFDAVEAMVDNAKTDRFDSDQMQAVYEAYKVLLDAIESGEAPVNKQVAELQAELAKWPRVYWHSLDPKSIEEGYRVLSISGMVDCNCDKSWMEVYVDNPSYDGNPFAAPADFGLYSSSEAAKVERDKNK